MNAEELVERMIRAGYPPPIPHGEGWLTWCPVHDPHGLSERALIIEQNGRGPVTRGCSNPFCNLADVTTEVATRLATRPEATDSPIEQLRKELKTPRIARILKRGAGDAYDLDLEAGDGRDAALVALGNADALYSQTKIRAKLLPHTGISIPRFSKAADWDRIVELIDHASEPADTESDGDELRSWLAGYMSSGGCHHFDLDNTAQLYDLLDGLHERDPGTIITSDRTACVRLQPFRKWITREGLGFITQPELGLRLSRLGFTKRQLSVRNPANPDEKRNGRYWQSPPGFDVPTPQRYQPRQHVPSAPLYVEKSRGDFGADNGDTGTPNNNRAESPTTTGATVMAGRGHHA